MIKQPFVSGHVSSVYLSEPLRRGWGNERALWLEGISPKTMPNHSFSLFLPIHRGDMSESNVCHSIPRQPPDPTTNWRLLSCHLLSLPCLVALRQFTHSFPEKMEGRGLNSMEQALAFVQSYWSWWPIMAGNRLNRIYSLWNQASLWSSRVNV